MTSLPPAPYPRDTRAKGWRFELDYERIEQSGTWGLANSLVLEGLPLARPFLLAMWYAAWQQVPCGSLPSDERELAGVVGIPMRMFAEYREVLLRGWWQADDGRLYHPTLTARVLEMMAKRRSDADRQALKRRRDQGPGSAPPPPLGPPPGPPPGPEDPGNVTRDNAVSPDGVHRESSTDHRIPNASNTERATTSRAGPPPVDNSGDAGLPPHEARAPGDPGLKAEPRLPAAEAATPEACFEAIAGAGFAGGHRGDARFAKACAAGVTPGEWAAAAADAKAQGKSWPWLLAAALNRHLEAAQAPAPAAKRSRAPPEAGNGDAARPAAQVIAAMAALGPSTPEQVAAAEAARAKVMARLGGRA